MEAFWSDATFDEKTQKVDKAAYIHKPTYIHDGRHFPCVSAIASKISLVAVAGSHPMGPTAEYLPRVGVSEGCQTAASANVDGSLTSLKTYLVLLGKLLTGWPADSGPRV